MQPNTPGNFFSSPPSAKNYEETSQVTMTGNRPATPTRIGTSNIGIHHDGLSPIQLTLTVKYTNKHGQIIEKKKQIDLNDIESSQVSLPMHLNIDTRTDRLRHQSLSPVSRAPQRLVETRYLSTEPANQGRYQNVSNYYTERTYGNNYLSGNSSVSGTVTTPNTTTTVGMTTPTTYTPTTYAPSLPISFNTSPTFRNIAVPRYGEVGQQTTSNYISVRSTYNEHSIADTMDQIKNQSNQTNRVVSTQPISIMDVNTSIETSSRVEMVPNTIQPIRPPEHGTVIRSASPPAWVPPVQIPISMSNMQHPVTTDLAMPQNQPQVPASTEKPSNNLYNRYGLSKYTKEQAQSPKQIQKTFDHRKGIIKLNGKADLKNSQPPKTAQAVQNTQAATHKIANSKTFQNLRNSRKIETPQNPQQKTGSAIKPPASQRPQSVIMMSKQEKSIKNVPESKKVESPVLDLMDQKQTNTDRIVERAPILDSPERPQASMSQVQRSEIKQPVNQGSMLDSRQYNSTIIQQNNQSQRPPTKHRLIRHSDSCPKYNDVFRSGGDPKVYHQRKVRQNVPQNVLQRWNQR